MKEEPKYCYQCYKKMQRAIYWGFPVWVCDCDDMDCTVDGFWSFIVEFMPNPNGMFVFYPYKGSYWTALYRYMMGEHDN